MSDEEPRLLGNLPRKRPGTRSTKRAPQPEAPERPAPQRRAPDAPPADDPVGDVVRGAARAAEAGLRVANDLTREVLRRLPRR
jgi:hypothetical protein